MADPILTDRPHGQPALGHTPEAAHEPSDVSARPIIVFAGGFVLFSVAVLLFLWWYTVYLDQREAREKVSRNPLAAGERGQLPPAPVIEGFDPTHKVGRLQPRVTETPGQRRDGYGKDPKTGQYQIPVERAMELLERRLTGQPAKKEGP